MDKRHATDQSWWQAHRPTTRRLVQLYAALLHNAYVRGFIDGKIYEGNAKYLCMPGLNCYSCPGAVGACPLGAVQNALSSAGHRAGWYVTGMILLYGVMLGRTICGWLCPVGLIQELLHRIPTPKIRKSRITLALSWLKYGFLAVFVIAIPLWYGLAKGLPLPGFCKYICPAGTFEGAVGHLANPANASMYEMLGVLFTSKWVIMVVIALVCVFCYRGFCRMICPLGAIYGLFNRFSIVGVRVDTNRCTGCGACVRHCGMDVRHVGDRECISCGKCMDVCGQGAISLKAGRITLKAPANAWAGSQPDVSRKHRPLTQILWGIAIAVLCFALVWFNFLDPSIHRTAVQAAGAVEADAPVTNWVSDAPVGFEVGQQLEDFTLTCYDGSEFHLADYRGKVVVINRWATWCAPCIQELPYFETLYNTHRDDIAMLVLHPAMVVLDPEEFLSGMELSMPCATDADGDPVKTIVGGTATLPQTIVLNRKGEVVYNSVKSVSPELLEALYLEASGQSGY